MKKSEPKCRAVPQQVIDVARVIAFAKENGFPKAMALYWDVNEPEYGLANLEDMEIESGEKRRVRIGIDLGAPELVATRDCEEVHGDGEIYFMPNAKDQT